MDRFWCISLLFSGLTHDRATFPATCPHNKKTGIYGDGGSKELTLCRTSTSNSFLQQVCSIFFSPPPFIISPQVLAYTSTFIYRGTYLQEGKQTLRKGRLGKASVSDTQQESGNFLICKHLTQSFLFILHLKNIFTFSVSPRTLCMGVWHLNKLSAWLKQSQ